MRELIKADEYVDEKFAQGHTWTMTSSGLECVDCPANNNTSVETIKDFSELDITGNFNVHIKKGAHYDVKITGKPENKDHYEITKEGETLVIDYHGRHSFDWDFKNLHGLEDEAVVIEITMPELKAIDAKGMGSIHFDDFETPEFAVDLKGPVYAKGTVHTDYLTIELTGKSTAELVGIAKNLDADIKFASMLNASELTVSDAAVETAGVSSAELHVTERLELEEGLTSKISYKGNPKVVRR